MNLSAVAALVAPVLATVLLATVLLATVLVGTVLAAAPGPARADGVVARIPTDGDPIVVVDEGPWRCFHFDGGADLEQSCMHRDEPERVRFEYVRMMFAATLVVEEPRRVLVLGLGGATLPRLVRAFHPAATIDAVEIEPAVVAMARRYFGFTPDERTHVHVEDARAFVERAADGAPYDLVLVDCFDATFIPPSLRTVGFARAVSAVLAPDGAVIVNVFSTNALYARLVATWGRVFPALWRMRGREAGNHVLVAARKALAVAPTTLSVRAAVRAAAAERPWPYPVAPMVGRIEPVPAAVLGAPPLRDPPLPQRPRPDQPPGGSSGEGGAGAPGSDAGRAGR